MNLEIGAKIRQLRQARSMTQEQLGSALGISAQAVSKWESATTMPDIQLLPELSVLFGVSIDELFSVTDERRMERIDNMIDSVRFIPKSDFLDAERFLKEAMLTDRTKPRATLLLAALYAKRANEYNDIAAPLARQALLLNPDKKSAHNAIFDAERGPYRDWNVTNHWKLIDFYKDFIKAHPDNHLAYLWLLDLLLSDGRTAEARKYTEAMEKIEHTFRTDYYRGRIAKEECDLPGALAHWQHMLEEFPNDWLPWALHGDCMARLCRYDEAIGSYEKALALQPPPRYVDSPEAIAQIAEIQGDYEKAIAMREACIDICRSDWNMTDEEALESHKREIARLQEKIKNRTL